MDLLCLSNDGALDVSSCCWAADAATCSSLGGDTDDKVEVAVACLVVACSSKGDNF